ncbi:MAG: phosphoglycerate dehydrogenase [Clostridiales bacterium]|nr:phosphoglycerate dehydrogenase [Clostridiales bacterium]MDD6872698.1 phosphoglycerate dehydrogenase [Clostridiales bacterium]MDD7366692.1 phosphoglycerate dehydrogenase [Clostridiales bacterium]MDY2871229.1 phosphoglycerate dehydrogenase [Eubacteriales bacterium]
MFNIKTLNEISPVYKNVLAADKFTVGKDIENPDAIIVRSAAMHDLPVPEKLLAVGRAGAGYNNIPVEDYGKRGVVVFNTPGANANAVKELAIAALLLASRDIVGGIEWAQTLRGQGAAVAKLVEKGKNQFVGPEIMGKTLGVIGLGGVGGLVANAAADLKMRVLGYDPYISVANAWKLSRKIVHVDNQDEMLPQCDYLSIHVPLMDSTRGSFNAAVFAKMKDGAALLNLARGELVNNADLLAAIAGGKIRRYVTDFPCDELLGQRGVVAIPHLGASTPESEDNCVDMISRQLEDYLETGSIVNSVNYPACPLTDAFRYRLTVMHANVPNTVGRITSALAEQGVNIDNMVNKSRGEFAYTVLDLDDALSEETIRRVEALEPVYRARYFARV